MVDLDIRLRLYSDTGVRGRVLRTSAISHSALGGSPALTFTVSERVAGQLDAPFLVGVEYNLGGKTWLKPRDDLFIARAEDGDSLDQSGTVSFAAEGIVSWWMRGFPLWWRTGDAELYRSFDAKTPGFVLNDLISSAKAVQGWAPLLTLGFTATADSAGNAWSETVTQKWPLFTTTLSGVVQSLTDQGYLEWWSEGFTLKVVNAGTGVDRSGSVVMGGPGFTRAPSKAEFNPATALVVQYDLGWTHFENPGAVTRFGPWFQVMSQSGAPTRAAAEKNAQPALTAARAMERELSYEWTPTAVTPRPFVDFQVGDMVTARTRRGKLQQRVVGTVVSKRGGVVTARAVVGSKLLNLTAKLANRSAAATVGQIIGGSGAGIAPVQGAGAAPVAPTAVRVTSNTGSWGSDGTALSTVTVAWDQVGQAVDGSGMDPDLYEVWSREPSGVASLLAATSGLEVTVESFRPGVLRLVKVRARSRAGVWSAFSDEISVTPTAPVSIIPKAPGVPVEGTNTGVFRADGAAVATVTFSWPAVTQSTDDLPLLVAAYQPMVEDGTAWVPLAETTGLTASITVPSGLARRVRVRARTDLGVWGDPSPVLTVTGAMPAPITSPPTVPVLTTGGGGVFATWDGELTSGTPPAGFQGVYGEYRVGTTGAFTRLAGPVSVAAGQVSGQVRAAVGATVQVRFILLDTLGRPGTPSAVASIIAAGLSTEINAGEIVGDMIADAAISVGKLANNAVTRDKLAAAAVGTNEIADFAITARKFNTGRHIIF